MVHPYIHTDTPGTCSHHVHGTPIHLTPHTHGTCGQHIHGAPTHSHTHTNTPGTCGCHVHGTPIHLTPMHLVLVVIMYMVHQHTHTHTPGTCGHHVHDTPHTHTHTPCTCGHHVHGTPTHSHPHTWYLWSLCTWYTNTLTPTHLVLVVIMYMIHPILTPTHLVLVVIMYMVPSHIHSHPHTWYLWSSCTWCATFSWRRNSLTISRCSWINCFCSSCCLRSSAKMSTAASPSTALLPTCDSGWCNVSLTLVVCTDKHSIFSVCLH